MSNSKNTTTDSGSAEALTRWQQHWLDTTRTGSWEPQDYVCPFCELAAGDPSDRDNLCELTDMVYQDELVMAFIACDGFGPRPGHVMIVPTQHHETLYTLPADVQTAIMSLAQELAFAIKLAWSPEGVSTRQHNEPAGNQHVWHYHLHIFPRYRDDNLYRQLRERLPVAFRAEKARELSAALTTVQESKQQFLAAEQKAERTA
ncbi:HIT family protein [Micrococcoides hystricis]|uniref:HIT family protein n=1 Tax=Micrococcoides hystricis TaxID=1572761 RepID=A0ABV6P8W2_9MICC